MERCGDGVPAPHLPIAPLPRFNASRPATRTGATVTTRLIRADEARRRIGIGRTLFEQMVARGELPQPVRVGTVRTWVDAEIEDWVVNHIAAQRRATG